MKCTDSNQIYTSIYLLKTLIQFLFKLSPFNNKKNQLEKDYLVKL